MNKKNNHQPVLRGPQGPRKTPFPWPNLGISSFLLVLILQQSTSIILNPLLYHKQQQPQKKKPLITLKTEPWAQIKLKARAYPI